MNLKLALVWAIIVVLAPVSSEANDFKDKCEAPEVGGVYNGSACGCSDGTYINPYVQKCKPTVTSPQKPSKLLLNPDQTRIRQGIKDRHNAKAKLSVDPLAYHRVKIFESPSSDFARAIVHAHKSNKYGDAYHSAEAVANAFNGAMTSRNLTDFGSTIAAMASQGGLPSGGIDPTLAKAAESLWSMGGNFRIDISRMQSQKSSWHKPNEDVCDWEQIHVVSILGADAKIVAIAYIGCTDSRFISKREACPTPDWGELHQFCSIQRINYAPH